MSTTATADITRVKKTSKSSTVSKKKKAVKAVKVKKFVTEKASHPQTNKISNNRLLDLKWYLGKTRKDYLLVYVAKSLPLPGVAVDEVTVIMGDGVYFMSAEAARNTFVLLADKDGDALVYEDQNFINFLYRQHMKYI